MVQCMGCLLCSVAEIYNLQLVICMMVLFHYHDQNALSECFFYSDLASLMGIKRELEKLAHN